MTTPIQWAYLAGFYDGEGTITTTKQQRADGVSYYQLRFVISNTSYEVLKSLQEQFGGSIHGHKPTNTKHRKFFQWYMSSVEKTVPVLKGMLPYLRYKTQEIELALEFFKRIRQSNQGTKLTPQELMARIDLINKIRSLPGRRRGGRLICHD